VGRLVGEFKPTTMTTLSTSAKEWDQVRSAFATSIMVDTALSSLAQNLDGPDWPLKGKAETPSAYIDLTYDEVTELLALKGQPPERLDQLLEILRDTLAFDDPFGDMVAQAEASSVQDNPILKNLAKLAIPPDYPIELTALSRETLEFCGLEKLTTLAEFAVFAQSMAQSVIVGGDFRTLLNALSHIDEAVIAKFLPFRPGEKGLHLLEAVAFLVRAQPAEAWGTLAAAKGPVPIAISGQLGRLLGQFSGELAELRQRVHNGESVARVVTVLGNPQIEAVVVGLLTPHLSPPPVVSSKRGWFSRWFGR
jgi:hypothetical protein